MFVIIANCNFVPGKYGVWQQAYDKLAEYVWANEPDTRTYYFGLPLQYWTNHIATTHMLAFEIYTDRQALYSTHLSSPVMTEFLEQITPTMTTGLDLSHYEDVGGFLDRFDDSRECEVMTDVRITCNLERRDAMLKRLVDFVVVLESSDPKGVLTFMILKSLDNTQGIRIFQRFSSWRAQSDLAADGKLLDVWMSSKEDILSLETQSYVPNGKGWLHRGESALRGQL